MYQVVQDLNKGGFLLSSGMLYRFVRNEFIKTIPNPMIRPNISPNRTFLIRVPITSPITIAIRKAISPRLISTKGFFFSIFYSVCRPAITFNHTVNPSNSRYLFNAIKLASKRMAPGTAAGSSLKKTNPV